MSLNYASGTTVSSGQTIGQIQDLISKVGGDRFGYFTEPGRAVIVFAVGRAMFRYALPMADPSDPKFTEYYRGSVRQYRTESASRQLYEAEANRRWRALGALIKAELVAVEEGIMTLQQALAPHLLTARNKTIAEEVGEQIDAIGAGATLALPWGTNE